MDIVMYTIFLTTTVMLILVPGPAAITIAGQGASNSSKKAFMGVLGVASADVIFFALSSTGIASLILTSSLLFSVIKWFGVAYLLYLGFTALFGKAGAIKVSVKSKEMSRKKLFSQGILVQLANPKALMYFSALLPQFIDPSAPIFLQMVIMGTTCLIADIVVYSLFSRLGEKLAKQQLKAWMVTAINKVAGITLVSVGISMASLEYGK